VTEIQVLLRALSEAYAQLDMARARIAELSATQSAAETEGDE
jgi:hypothetical protein